MTNEGFLRWICEHPADDAARLVYSDWLEGQGDLARAEFIRAQVAVAPLSRDDPQRGLLHRRLGEIYSRTEAWRAQLPRLPGVNWSRFWRGFVSGAMVQGWKFYEQHADAIFAATPVQFLSVRCITNENCRRLTQSPYLVRLLGLGLTHYIGTDEGIHALAECEHLRGLAELAITCSPMFAVCGESGVRALIASPYLPRELRLRLDLQPSNPKVARALRERFPNIVHR